MYSHAIEFDEFRAAVDRTGLFSKGVWRPTYGRIPAVRFKYVLLETDYALTCWKSSPTTTGIWWATKLDLSWSGFDPGHLTFEQVFNSVDEDVRKRLSFHLDLFI